MPHTTPMGWSCDFAPFELSALLGACMVVAFVPYAAFYVFEPAATEKAFLVILEALRVALWRL